MLLHLAQVVVEPGFAQAFVGRQVGDDVAAERELGGVARQAFEEPGDGFDGGGLVGLVGVELETKGHGRSFKCQVEGFSKNSRRYLFLYKICTFVKRRIECSIQTEPFLPRFHRLSYLFHSGVVKDYA